ncbi:MAG: restriction endonuclease subunit S [Prevotella sp.]|nr:restriction endonuclease subunit S [Prevotella sp.]
MNALSCHCKHLNTWIFDGLRSKCIVQPIGKVLINGEMLSVTLNNGIIKAAENGRYDNSNSDKSHYKLVKINDIAYNSMRMWQGASGCSKYEGIVSPAYTVVTPAEGVSSPFFAYLFKTQAIIQSFRLHSQGLTSDTWNLKYPAFSKISVIYPSDIEEQKCIASYFTSLDTQISLQTQRLEKLKQIKSACLDNMFV